MADRVLLQVREITKAFGEKIIFNGASVNIVEKQKIGVIGRNGAGKTTFFKMILDKEETDTGEIVLMPHLRLGYIEQNDPFLEGETVISFLQRYTGKEDWECGKMAAKFQLKNEKLQSKISDLSGGYQMRVKLTATLLFEPNLLLLDEPTNYLDLSTLILLEQFLKTFKGAFMVITHDREFIKKTCLQTLDVAGGQLLFHPEPLEEYLEYKEEQEALAASVNVNIERKQKQLQEFISKYGAKASKAASAQSKRKQIIKLDEKKISIGRAFSAVKMYIPPIENKQGIGLEVKNLNTGYEGKVITSDIKFTIDRGNKVAILGDNGQGKSTLLKTIAGKLGPVSGNVFWKDGLKIAFYNQHVSEEMIPTENILEYIKRVVVSNVKDDEIYRVLGNFLFKKLDYTKLISYLSGGEKARLCLAGMFLSKADVYLLDEPTNHLDFETVESMGDALGKFNGTVFVVSHNRTFVNLIANQIMEVKDGHVRQILGTYEDYVWQLEEAAQKESLVASSSLPGGEVQRTKGAVSESSTTGDYDLSKAEKTKPSKEAAKRIFELKKDLSKTEKKIKQLQELVSENVETEKNQVLVADLEVRWLEIQGEIEKLGG